MQNTWIIQFNGTSYITHYTYPTIKMRFTERVMTAERCMNNTSSFTYRKTYEAWMTKNAVIITKQPYSYMLINN